MALSDHYDKRNTALAKQRDTVPHKLRAESLALALRQDSHRRQSHPQDWFYFTLHRDRGEEDVTHYDFIYSHEGQRLSAVLLKTLREVGFERFPKGNLIDASHSGGVLKCLEPDSNHWFEVPNGRGLGAWGPHEASRILQSPMAHIRCNQC